MSSREFFGLILGLGVAMALGGCGKTCSASNCTGCCDATNTCQTPSASDCGVNGVTCVACLGIEVCDAVGQCTFEGNGGNAGSTGSHSSSGSSGSQASTGQGSTNQGTTGQGSTNQGTTGQGSTNQGNTNQGNSGQGSTNQGTTGQGSTIEGSTGLGTTGQSTTSNGTTGSSSGSCPCTQPDTVCDVGTNTCVAGCLQDTGCTSGQICTNGQCVTGCRQDSSCGSGEICQNNLCITGCRGDSQCGSGAICQNNNCQTGCRTTANCTQTGDVCDPNTLTCRAGCTNNSQCSTDQICSTSTLTCVTGCVQDTGCRTGQICLNGQCQNGCRQDTDCPLQEYCAIDGGNTCQSGCAYPWAPQGDPSRCEPGEACVPFDCSQPGEEACGYECQQNCNGWTCNDPFTCWDPSNGNNPYDSYCRQSCNESSDCPSGQVCAYFTDDGSDPGDNQSMFCASPCSSNSDCSNTVDSYGNLGGVGDAGCVCYSDGVCQYTDQYVCYQLSADAQLPSSPQ